MRILVIADPFIPVPPGRYGGTERMVDLQCRGLAARGHEVRLLAGPGSEDYGGGLSIHYPPSAAMHSRAWRKLYFQTLLLRALPGVDVVINHGRLDYLELLYRTRIPALHWLHNPLTGQEVSFVRSRRNKGDRFVGVSQAQIAANPVPDDFLVIHNAVDPETIPFWPTAKEPSYVLFMGRLTRNKGVDQAVLAARAAGVPLFVAGNVPHEPGEAEFFEQEIRPNFGERCGWIGSYTTAERNQLLAGAAALLFPIRWAEPFGLVMIEAMAAGVPVIASRCASTPEVIEPGRTGFLCDSVEAMAAAIGQVGTLSRKACRRAVEQKFSCGLFIDRVEAALSAVVP